MVLVFIAAISQAVTFHTHTCVDIDHKMSWYRLLIYFEFIVSSQFILKYHPIISLKSLFQFISVLTGAELSRLPEDRTKRPRTSTPSVVMLPAAFTGFSPISEQSSTTFTEVLLTITCSCKRESYYTLKLTKHQ